MDQKETTTMNLITYKNRTFAVDTEEKTRVVAFEGGQPVHEGQTQWNIREDGKLLAFVFDEEMVPQTIREMVDFPRTAEVVNCRFD